MAENEDDATCDRCGLSLPGYGVLFGMLTTDLASGLVRSLIFCYANGCRDALLAGHLNSTSGCTNCGTALQRGLDTALLAVDVDLSTDEDLTRPLAFCYANGCRDLVLAVAQ